MFQSTKKPWSNQNSMDIHSANSEEYHFKELAVYFALFLLATLVYFPL